MPKFVTERRRGERLSLTVGTSLTFRGLSLQGAATTVNVSDSGALLRFESAVDLEAGQRVICDFALPKKRAEAALVPCWAEGKVKWVDGTDVALEFTDILFGENEQRDSDEDAA